MTVDRLLVTLGRSPVPVVHTLMGLRPRQVGFLVEASDAEASPESTIPSILRTCTELGHTPDRVLTATVDRYRPDEVRTALAGPLSAITEEAGWHLGYSGGSPTMAMTALQLWSHPTQHGPADASEAWYVVSGRAPHGSGSVTQLAPTRGQRVTVELDANPTLESILGLHGWAARGEAGRKPLPADDAQQEAAGDGSMALARPLPHQIPATDAAHLNSELKAACARVLVEVAAPADVYANIRVTRGGRDLDIDAAIVNGLALHLVAISVYLSEDPRDAGPSGRRAYLGDMLAQRKERAFLVEQQAHMLGGEHARSTVILFDADNSIGPPPQRTTRKLASTLARDRGDLGRVAPSYRVAIAQDLATSPALGAWIRGAS